jgi:hypothetical protein
MYLHDAYPCAARSAANGLDQLFRLGASERAGAKPDDGLLDQGSNGIPPAGIMADQNYTGVCEAA